MTNQISTIEGVEGSIMMATPANKDIYRQSGLSTEELEGASANDMVVVAMWMTRHSGCDHAEVEEFFKNSPHPNLKRRARNP
ncbi:MAG: hypothetical protein ACLVJO_12300 [[Clostridium] scindens]